MKRKTFVKDTYYLKGTENYCLESAQLFFLKIAQLQRDEASFEVWVVLFPKINRLLLAIKSLRFFTAQVLFAIAWVLFRKFSTQIFLKKILYWFCYAY